MPEVARHSVNGGPGCQLPEMSLDANILAHRCEGESGGREEEFPLVRKVEPPWSAKPVWRNKPIKERPDQLLLLCFVTMATDCS